MLKMSATVTIDRPPEDVFDHLTDPSAQTTWQSGLVEFQPDWQGQLEAGDRAHGVTQVAGKKFKWVVEYPEVEPPSMLTFRSVEAPFPFEFRYELTERDGSTQLQVTGTSESLKGFFGKLTDPLVTRMYERNMRSNLENLKAILEQSTP